MILPLAAPVSGAAPLRVTFISAGDSIGSEAALITLTTGFDSRARYSEQPDWTEPFVGNSWVSTKEAQMPAASVGDQRWVSAGTNAAGDRVFTRDRGGSGGGYASLSKEELQAELERRDLPKTGNKDELIERLQAADV